MKVQIAHPSATPQQIEAHLRATFPRYTVVSRAGFPLVGNGSATGVLVRPSGQGQVNLVWAFPSMGVQILVTLTIVLTGLLPGLFLFLIVWLSVKSGVERLKQEIATVLTGGAPPPQLPVDPALAGGAPPSSATPIAAVICFVLALLSLVPLFFFGEYIGAGAGLQDLIFWIALGVGALMYHGARKSGSASNAGLWVIAVFSILHGLHALSYVFNLDGFAFVKALVGTLMWLAIGGVLIAVIARKTPLAPAKVAPAVLAAGGVLALLGLLSLAEIVERFIDGLGVNAMTTSMALRSVLWIALGAIVAARGNALRTAPPAVAPAQPAPQQQYPQQQYPQQQQYPGQQQYPQQQYPQQPPGYPPPGWPGPQNKS